MAMDLNARQARMKAQNKQRENSKMLRQLKQLRDKNQSRSNVIAATLATRIRQEKSTAMKLDIIAGNRQPIDYAEAQEIARELGKKTDMAAQIADAIFAANPAPIYEAMLKRLLQGDSKMFATLAARAYGEPVQEIVQHQSQPFELIIKHIGAKEAVEVIEGEVANPQLEPAPDRAATEAE